MVSHSGLLTVMERAARKAGSKLRRDFGEVEHLQVSRKGPADFVSKADQQAERTLVEELQKARPDWGFLLEEGGEIAGDPTKPRWIIDPLDGTTNFLHGIPHFAISIAVEEPLYGGNKREVTTGLIYQPVTDESYWAEKSRGAWRHDQRLRVSARRDMADCVIATGIPFMGHGDMAQWTRIFGAVAPSIAGIRRFGAAALDLAQSDACEAAWTSWKNAIRHRPFREDYKDEHDGKMRSAMASCYANRAAASTDDATQAEALITGLLWDHDASDVVALARPLAEAMESQGDALWASEDLEEAYQAFKTSVELDPRRSWARRKAEDVRDLRLKITRPGRKKKGRRG